MNSFNNKNGILTKERNHEFDLFDPFGDFFKFANFRENTVSGLMKTDVLEQEKSYILELDLPGYNKSDINIDLNNGYLTISATRKQNTETNGKYVRKERYFGSVSRSFYVGDIDQDQINAKLENGILLVEIPKEPKKEEKKRIEIM